jgi:hypothetical protein
MMVGKIILENSKDLAWIARLVEPRADGCEPASPHRSTTNPLMARSSVPIGLGASVGPPAAR